MNRASWTREADVSACGFLRLCGFWWGSFSFLYEFFFFSFFHKVSSYCGFTNKFIKKSYVRLLQSGIGPEAEILLPGKFYEIAQNQRLIFNTLFNIDSVMGFFNRIIKTAK